MYKALTVKVIDVLEKNTDYQKLKTDGGSGRAYLYLCSFPPVKKGEYVKVNTTAEVLRLGTGGWDIVLSTEHDNYILPGRGHIMKARYTPFQHSVHSVDDPHHPDYGIFQQSFSLKQFPVLLAELHSMLPILLGAVSMENDRLNIGVVLSDEASLAAGLSDHMMEWKQRSNVWVVTAGQAFGGCMEAVNVVNAMQWLVLKKRVDLLILSMGPGTTGTNTPYGFSGMALAEWANLIGSLEGMPFWVPRLSFHTTRERHYGLSYHTLTPLHSFTYARSTLVLPSMEGQKRAYVKQQLPPLYTKEHVIIAEENIDSWCENWLEWYQSNGKKVISMGTGVTSDPDFIKGVLAPLAYILRKQEVRKDGL
ncbi:DUF3866 family protein [Salibacterium qingdaonense]|uniref:DUF3866 domain-containing protein n=1 Tax=Salibacterium qingdaonense TaxID=266892 RepID=A0A1I4JSG8_9BACI|nr:DUF3866 family protein [Salibacterium qingdaonense]SFL69271.1 Protein of unknown function [Salibacterium qingdaonense]